MPVQPRYINFVSLTLFGLIAGLPAAYMLAGPVWGDGELGRSLSDMGTSRQAGLFMRSLGMAAAAAILSVLLGTLQALLTARTRDAALGWWRHIYLLPLCIPPHIHTIAWIYLGGDTGIINRLLAGIFGPSAPRLDIYNPLWAAVILALAYHPLVTLMARSGLASMDSRMEDAALQYRPPARVLKQVTLPLLLPHIFAGAVFVFIFAFFDYGVPALLRVHTYPVEIFAQFSAFYNEAGATALALPVILVAFLLLAVQGYLMRGRSYVVMDSGRTRARLLSLDRWRVPAAWYLAVLAGTAVVLPLAVLTVQTRGPAVFKAVWRSAGPELIFTVCIAIAAATAIVLLAFLLGGIPKKGIKGGMLDFVFFAPLALPATVLGIGLIHVWNRPSTQVVYSSAVIVVIAYTARFVSFSLLAVTAGMRQVGTSLREAACLYQGSFFKRSIAVDLPLCLPALAAAWGIAFILCMGELGTTLLIIPPGMGTLSLKIYTLMHYGANQMVAALSLVLVLVNLAAAAGICFATGRLGAGPWADTPKGGGL